MAEKPTYEELEKRIGELERDELRRKRAEGALRESEKNFRNLFEQSNDAIFVHQRGKIIDVNQRASEMTGFSKDKLLTMFITDLPIENMKGKSRDRLDVARRGEAIFFETRWQRADGSLVDVEISSRIVDHDESIIQGVARDITDRKKAEEALQASHERFLTVLDSIDATIYVGDMETHEIIFMNKYMIESFGRDMTGEICWEAFRGESKPCQHCTNDQLIDESGKMAGVFVWQGENPITGKWYLNHDRAIEWTDGRLVRLQIATDITNLKRMEEQLRQAHKMEAIGTLAGGIAHDFNNILTPFIVHTEMAMMDLPEGHPVQNNLKGALKAGYRARDLVKQILAFSRQQDSEATPNKVEIIVKEALKLLRASIPSTINIQQKLEAKSDTILADPTQIHQIIMNLCTNAAHAMSETGGVLEVKTENVLIRQQDLNGLNGLEPGEYLKLTVSDTGHGMDQGVLGRIFEPYYTTKDKQHGTGLGLSVLHGIIKTLNGDLTVASKPGEGSVFCLYIPLAKAADQNKLESISDKKLPQGNENILLVDDEKTMVDAVQAILERLGYQVTVRTSSIEALELFESKPDAFDLIITDQTMPNMTGKELAKKLISIRAGIPIILCTGFSEQIDEKKAKEIGISTFKMKPIVMRDIAHTIREVLDRK